MISGSLFVKFLHNGRLSVLFPDEGRDLLATRMSVWLPSALKEDPDTWLVAAGQIYTVNVIV